MRNKIRPEEYPVNSILDILSNTMGFILLIMMTLTLLAFSRSIYSGNTDETIPIRIDPQNDWENDLLPLSIPADRDKYPVYVLVKNGKFFYLDTTKIYPLILQSFISNVNYISNIAGDFMFNFRLVEDETIGISLQIQAIETEGFEMDALNTNRLKLIKSHLGIPVGESNNYMVNPESHYFLFEVYPNSIPEYQWLNQLMFEEGFDTGVIIAMKIDFTNWEEIIFQNSDNLFIQYDRDNQ